MHARSYQAKTAGKSRSARLSTARARSVPAHRRPDRIRTRRLHAASGPRQSQTRRRSRLGPRSRRPLPGMPPPGTSGSPGGSRLRCGAWLSVAASRAGRCPGLAPRAGRDPLPGPGHPSPVPAGHQDSEVAVAGVQGEGTRHGRQPHRPGPQHRPGSPPRSPAATREPDRRCACAYGAARFRCLFAMPQHEAAAYPAGRQACTASAVLW
jgi:hypothetical protein